MKHSDTVCIYRHNAKKQPEILASGGQDATVGLLVPKVHLVTRHFPTAKESCLWVGIVMLPLLSCFKRIRQGPFKGDGLNMLCL